MFSLLPALAQLLTQLLGLQGSKIRSSYITFAHKEKKRLEALVQTYTQEIAVREKEVARLKGAHYPDCLFSSN